MKNLILILCAVFMLTSCDGRLKKQAVNEVVNSNTTQQMGVKDRTFEDLFSRVDSAQVRTILARLMASEDHTVITAGTDSLYNSMAASWEALGRYFEKPTTFSLLGANRYTLEFIRKQQTYTMSFFSDQYNGDVFAFGRKSGRNSDKMKETKLTHVQTPAGNITYKEANVIIECRLFEITTVNPNDFYTKDGKDFVEAAHNDTTDYHKLVFGTITNIWVRKGEQRANAEHTSASAIVPDALSGATYLASSEAGHTTVSPDSSLAGEVKESKPSKSYPIIVLSLTTLLSYVLTWWLQKRKYITKVTHRKIWNVVLLISFLVAGLLGLFLVFQINYCFGYSIYTTINTLHVDLGIIMAIVSILHCFWHLDYYKKIFARKKVV